MKAINSEFLRKAINEAVKQIMVEDGLGGGLGKSGGLGGGLGKSGGLGGGLGKQGLGGGGLGKQGFSGTANLVRNAASGKQFSTEGGVLKNGMHLPKVLNARFDKWHEEENPNRDTATNEDEILKVYIGYIFPQHTEYLVEKWKNDYPDVFTPQWVGYGKNYMEFRVKPDMEQEFINIVPKIFDDIAALSGVNPKFYKKKGWTMQPTPKQNVYATDKFQDKVAETIDYITKAPSKYEQERRDINIASTWKELLLNMEDPNTLRRLQGIGGMVYSTSSATLSGGAADQGGNPYDNRGRKVGHVISFENKQEVFSQDPNATFVTQEWVWRDFFNRKVVDRNKTIIITKPTTRKPRDPNSFEKACIKCNYGGAADFYDQKKRGELSQSQIWAVMAEYNKLNPADTLFGPVIVYDVANTEVMTDENGNPMTDKFNDEVNLADNIKGIPNAVTNAADEELAKKLNAKYIQGQMQSLTDDELKEINKTIAGITQRDAGNCSNTGNIGDDIIANTYKLAQLKSNSINFSREEFREAYCQAFSCAVAATYGFSSPKGAQYLKQCLSNKGNTDKELSTMIQLFFSYYKKFVSEVNYDLAKKATKMKKAGAKLSTPVPNVHCGNAMSKVVEEDGVGQEQGLHPVQPLTPEQLSKVLGIPEELFTGGYEVQDEPQTNAQLQESFFNMLDRIELIK